METENAPVEEVAVVTEDVVPHGTTTEEDTKVEEKVEDKVEESTKAETEDNGGKTLKEEARKWEARSKANRAEADELKVKAEAFETELTEYKSKADEYKSALNAKTTEAARLRAAIENGLSLDDLDFLTGSNAEEIAASAKKFAARIGSSGSRVSIRTQGASINDAKPLSEQERLMQKIAAAREANK